MKNTTIKHMLCAVMLLSTLAMSSVQAAQLKVAAASDLTHALPVLAEAFEAVSGHQILISFGSSGNLTRQIIQGAPFEIFFSANETFVNTLVERGLTVDTGALYALGQLALFVPSTSNIPPSADLSTLDTALTTNRLQRLALANPEHAPYGIAARAALQSAGLWARLQPRLVLGENAAQAAQFSVSGNVDAGLIPYSIAYVPAFSKHGRFSRIKRTLYQPLRQRMVVLQGAGPAARALFDFVLSAPAQAIFEQFGFERPVDL